MMGYTPALEILPPLSIGFPYAFGFQLLGGDGEPVPLTDAVITCNIHRTQHHRSSIVASFRVSVVDLALAKVRFDLREVETQDLPEGNYYYWCKIVYLDDRKDIIFKGTIEFLEAGES